MANPVGTGPYLLKEWRRGQKITLEANPGFRDETFPDSADPADRAIVAQMRGKKLPAIGRVEVSILEEANPRLLAFEKRDLDYLDLQEMALNVLDGNQQLKPKYAQQGITLARGLRPAIRFTYFNMEDPVVGGYTKEKIALRRAIGMAYNTDEETRVVWQGQADAGDAVPAAARVRLRPGAARISCASTSPPPRRCSTGSATSIATGTAGATCRTASR